MRDKPFLKPAAAWPTQFTLVQQIPLKLSFVVLRLTCYLDRDKKKYSFAEENRHFVQAWTKPALTQKMTQEVWDENDPTCVSRGSKDLQDPARVHSSNDRQRDSKSVLFTFFYNQIHRFDPNTRLLQWLQCSTYMCWSFDQAKQTRLQTSPDPLANVLPHLVFLNGAPLMSNALADRGLYKSSLNFTNHFIDKSISICPGFPPPVV